MNVFVYGTLKSGYGNNALLRDSTFVSVGTVAGYKLYDSGFPVARPSDGDTIIGEIWDIGDNENTLRNLDRLESEGRMYIRTPVKAIAENGTEMDVQMYVGPEAFWGFERMRECPKSGGNFRWERSYDGWDSR